MSYGHTSQRRAGRSAKAVLTDAITHHARWLPCVEAHAAPPAFPRQTSAFTPAQSPTMANAACRDATGSRWRAHRRARERSSLKAPAAAVKTALARELCGRRRVAAGGAVDKVKMLAEQARRETRDKRVTLPVQAIAGNAATRRIGQQRVDFICQIR